MYRRLVQTLWLSYIAAMALIAADASWKTKPAAQWTDNDARQVLTTSPWAREFAAGVAGRLNEDELRDAGQMGQPHGIGYDGVDPKKSGPELPANIVAGSRPSVRSTARTTTVRLRWESALPVQLAEVISRDAGAPTLVGDGYWIAVYGIPGGYVKGDPKRLGEPLKKEAALRREGKRDVTPSSVEAFFHPDGWTVVYLFPLSAEISPNDRYVEFDAHIGRIVVAQTFNLTEMKFLGKLAL